MAKDKTSQPERPKLTGTSATELRVIVKEDSMGQTDVEWCPYIEGTEVAINMRPTQVLGSLLVAILILAKKFYFNKEK